MCTSEDPNNDLTLKVLLVKFLSIYRRGGIKLKNKNKDNLVQFTLCPRCGSKTYLENYPIQNISICTRCQHEVTTITLIEIKETPQGTPSICTHCGKDGAEDNPFFEENHTIIYKCKACGKLDGYLLTTSLFSMEEIDDNAYDGKTVQYAKVEGELYPKKPKHNQPPAIEYLTQLINSKKEAMAKMGVHPETINLATQKANNHLTQKQTYTDKQLKHIFPAAMILTQSELESLGKFKGKKLNERELEELFEADRKTTRKWKEILKSDVGSKNPVY